jgi:thiamine pyrophosphate-dependent acetolactate synthase large subunit-like protein
MKTREAMSVLAGQRGDAIVIAALGMAANEWWNATKSEDSLYLHGGMGLSASVALGLALSVSETQPVWEINTDGSLCMNLSGLLTEAGQQPKNLKHFVVDNGVYQTLDAPMPMVNQNRTDYAAIARGAGIERTATIESVQELQGKLPEILASPGPYFVVLKVEAEPDYLKAPPATYEGPEMKYRFGRALEKKLGVKVFGPRGY